MSRKKKTDSPSAKVSTTRTTSSGAISKATGVKAESNGLHHDASQATTRQRTTQNGANKAHNNNSRGASIGTTQLNGQTKTQAKAKKPPVNNALKRSSAGTSRIMSFFRETVPSFFAVSVMLGLIFGGCCSNVFALEAIIKPNPDSGTLLTFLQFLFIASIGYGSHFDSSRPPFFLKPNRVPLKRWLVNIALFFTINVLNNHAFSYNISVPIHIILRSGGSITTIAIGYLWGKRFSRTQILSVLLLTVGVIIAAWSDSQAKLQQAQEGKAEPPVDGVERPAFSYGLAVLFIAQVLSAVMGIYTEETYREYGPQWKENLFYSHFVALPLFIPFMPNMGRQFMRLAASEPLQLPWTHLGQLEGWGEEGGWAALLKGVMGLNIPSQLAYMALNVLTQYACIRGVNLLASTSSALTVTIVLNVRKLVSLLLSIWLFGNKLSPGTVIGAGIVFTSGGMYSLDRGKPRGRPRAQTGTQLKELKELRGENGKVG